LEENLFQKQQRVNLAMAAKKDFGGRSLMGLVHLVE